LWHAPTEWPSRGEARPERAPIFAVLEADELAADWARLIHQDTGDDRDH